jgi:hypothetical protein
VVTRKLTPGEISSTVEKIRKKYDEFVAKYYKPKSLREAYEERYIRALRSGVDISSFLIAEISVIEELTKKEEEKIALGPGRSGGEKEQSFADKVLEENRRRIAKYPEHPVPKDASEEVRRLLGALKDLEREHWPDVRAALKNTAYSTNSPEMLTLDSQLRFLATSDREEVPQFLYRLAAELRKFPRNYASIEREEKEYVLESAFFLNDLFMILERVRRVYTDLSEEEKLLLNASLAHVWGVISDFRMKSLKRKKRWEHGEN